MIVKYIINKGNPLNASKDKPLFINNKEEESPKEEIKEILQTL